jgi:hypothetical protein
MLLSAAELWHFLPLGYLLTILVEIPILMVGLSNRHSRWKRLAAGNWLTACTYPIVTLVLPLLFIDSSRTIYLVVAEIFAPVGECVLFWLAFGSRSETGSRSMWRDFAAIVVANLASFLTGELFTAYNWLGLLK